METQQGNGIGVWIDDERPASASQDMSTIYFMTGFLIFVKNEHLFSFVFKLHCLWPKSRHDQSIDDDDDDDDVMMRRDIEST